MELALKNKTNQLDKVIILTILTLITVYSIVNTFNHKIITYKPIKEIYFNNYNVTDTIYPLY